MLYLFAAVYQKTGADERSAPVFCYIKALKNIRVPPFVGMAIKI